MVTNDGTISGLKSVTTPTATSETKTDSTAASSTTTGAKNSEVMGQQEFLTLLVNQLQHQDPLNPMNSEEFAVQLAQFSQVEQLIEINKKLDSGLGGAESVASMASYLGTEVALGDSQLSVSGGQGSNLFVNIPGGTQSLRVDLKDETGQVVAQHAVPEFAYGPQTIALNGLDAADGKYDVRVVSVDQSGKFTDLDAKVTGTVEGFVLEPEPKLLVGGEEVSLENVSAVYKGAS